MFFLFAIRHKISYNAFCILIDAFVDTAIYNNFMPREALLLIF